MSDNKRVGENILKNSLVFFFGTILDKIFSFIAIVLITRYLSEEEFGIFNYAIIYISFFATFVDFGTESILIREISVNPNGARILLGNNILMKIFLTILAIVLSYVITVFADLSYKKELLIYIMFINLIFSPKLPTLKNSFESVFKVKLNVGFPVMMNILSSVVLLTIIIIEIQYECSLELITLGYVLSGLPGFILIVLKSKEIIKPIFSMDLRIWRYFLKESFPLAFYGLLINLSNRIDVLMLSWMKGDVEVGYYSAAFRLVLPLSFIPVSLIVSLLPVMSKLYSEKDENLKKIYQFSLNVMLFISIPLSVIIFSTSQQIINVIYSSRYFPSEPGLKILVVSQIFLFLNVIMTHLVISIGKQYKGLYVVIGMVIINIIFNIFLIPRYGLVGASISTVFTEFFATIFWIIFTKNYLKNFPFLTLFKIILINIICIIFMKFILYEYLILKIFGFLVIQMFLLIMFRVFSKEDISEFRTSIKR